MSMEAQAAAEQAVTGCLLLDFARAWKAVDGVLFEEDFEDRRYRLAFRLMLEMRSSGKTPNVIALAEAMEARQWSTEMGGLAFWVDTTQGPFSTANIDEYARIVREKSDLRKLAALTAKINALALDPGALTAAELRGQIAAALPETEGVPTGKTYAFRSMEDLAALPPMRWRIKGVLPDQGVTAIYGPSGSGKSFLALDIAGAINTGREWFGHRVKAAPVVYLCLEGQAGLRNRVAAYRTAHGGDSLRGVRFIVESFNILTGDPAALIRAIKGDGLENPVVVIDTLNRAAPGADENSGVDMGRIIEAAHAIQQATGGLAMLVHHCGKDGTKGMRGHSSLHAALDAVIEVKRGADGESREWSLAKAKDGADGIKYAFGLQVHHLGEDEDGDPVTSCSIVPGNSPERSGEPQQVPLGTTGTKAVDALKDLYEQHRSNLAESGGDPEQARVSYREWCEALHGMPKNRASEGRTQATKHGYVTVQNGYAYLVPPGIWNGSTGTGGMVPFRSTLPLGGGTGTGTGTTTEGTGTDGGWFGGIEDDGVPV